MGRHAARDRRPPLGRDGANVEQAQQFATGLGEPERGIVAQVPHDRRPVRWRLGGCRPVGLAGLEPATDRAGRLRRDAGAPGDLPQGQGRIAQQHRAGEPAPFEPVDRAHLPVLSDPAGRRGFGPVPADARDGRRGQPGDRRDHPVRPVRVRGDDPRGGRLPVREGQRQAVGDVGTHREDERVVLVAVEVTDRDQGLPTQPRGPQPVHPVDDPHGLAVHGDRG